MAAEGPPAASPRTPGATVPLKEAALPAAEAETPQDPSQTAQGSPATCQGDSRCSEEFVVNCTFAACDPEQTGTVLAQQVVEYLQAVTGQSGEEGQLQALRRMLDPEAAGTALDLPTFHAVMREWIASCQQEGGSRLAEEQDAAAGDLGLVLAVGEGPTASAAAQLEGDGANADIVSLTEAASLRSRAEQLATQNAKLQQDAESAEELNARLAEETAQLKAQLRCRSQQALEQARAAAEELEDLKAIAKRLEEENSKLRWQAHQLEKEQQCLRLQVDSLREENQQLFAEGHGLRERIQALAAETAKLEAQLGCCTALLSSQDTGLAQVGWRVEELTVALGEYNRAVQELRLETTQLCDQLGQTQDARATRPRCPLGEADVPAQPLSAEIEATCRETEEAEEEEDVGTAVPRTPAGDGEALAEPRQRPGPSKRLPAPRALLALLLLLALLALLCLLPRRWLGLPHGRAAWPQLRYQRPPPL
ncbi:protein KASH5 [Theristicus caerulescens]